MKGALLAIAILAACLHVSAQTSTLNRPNDPVVITGAQLPVFSSTLPTLIRGFKFENGSWVQIPIQIDERALLDIVTPYGSLAASTGYAPSASNPKILFYCDSKTNIGVDANPNFDSDDELVFMAKDAGGPSNGTIPPGVVAGSCQEITITDPLGGVGYIYLFESGGSLQGSGVEYVTYTSNVHTTAGFPAHLTGTFAENTTITTSKYSWHFAAEWVSDEYKLLTGNNTDILDRHKNFFADGNCGRHEDTFSAAENAFICVKDGPIRVIRSYMGANSGPLTQRTHWFYEGRHDIATDLRVHTIPSIYDVFDYNSNANGMVYRNNLNTVGVTIDGLPDTLAQGIVEWEQVSGTPGTVSIVYQQNTNVASNEATFSAYYDDNATNPASNCTGDGQAWGTSGIGMIFNNICTDPVATCNPSQYRYLQTTRIMYADSANAASTMAAAYHNQLTNPMVVSFAACQGPANYTVTTTASPTVGGTTTGDGSYASGTAVTVVATANTGYVFTNWTEGGTVVSASPSYSFNVFADRTLVANFDVSTTNYTITTAASPTVGGNTGGDGTFAAGTQANVTATANAGYYFVNWTENGTEVSTSLSYAFTLNSDRNLVANFALAPTMYTVALSVNPSTGGVTTGQGTYAEGTQVTVTATTFPNYQFVNWTEQGTVVSSDSVFAFNIVAHRDLVANFSLTSGINNVLLDHGIGIYPNPSNGIINISTSNHYHLKVFNVMGQVVLDVPIGLTSEVRLSDSGVYVLQFTTTYGTIIRSKVIVNK